MASQIPSKVLHEKAGQLRPKLSIKSTSTWCAILRHDVHRLDEIKDGSSFLWIKAHARITVKTLHYYYFTRQPIEQLAIQYGNKIVPEMTQVGELCQAVPEDNWIALRAIDEDDITDLALIDDARAIASQCNRNGLENYKIGSDKSNAIVVDDDDCEHDQLEEAGGIKDNEIKACQGEETEVYSETSDAISARDFDTQPIPVDTGFEYDANVRESSSMDSKEAGPEPSETNSARGEKEHNSNFTALMETKEWHKRKRAHQDWGEEHRMSSKKPKLVDAVIEPEEPAVPSKGGEILLSREDSAAELQDRFKALSKVAQDHIWTNIDRLRCEVDSCHQTVTLEPWTHFGPQQQPLCTACSAQFVKHEKGPSSREFAEIFRAIEGKNRLDRCDGTEKCRTCKTGPFTSLSAEADYAEITSGHHNALSEQTHISMEADNRYETEISTPLYQNQLHAAGDDFLVSRKYQIPSTHSIESPLSIYDPNTSTIYPAVVSPGQLCLQPDLLCEDVTHPNDFLAPFEGGEASDEFLHCDTHVEPGEV